MGDNVPRYHCDTCGYSCYQNPRTLVTCFAIWKDKALWMPCNSLFQLHFWAQVGYGLGLTKIPGFATRDIHRR